MNMAKFEVLTLHREHDGVCVVRLSGFDNRVFWREIKLSPRFSLFSTPREKILKAQKQAAALAEKLMWKEQLEEHEFNLARNT